MKPEISASVIFEKLYESKKRIIVLEGSARSTKTFSIIQYIILQHLQKKGLRTTIARSKLTWAKSSVVIDFLEILDTHFGLYNPSNWNKSEQIYRLNSGEVSFIGLDEPQKVHGRKQDIFWINEAIECEYKDFEQLIIRTTTKAILDYNPSLEQHWIYDKVIPRDDCFFIHSTFKDNPFLISDIRLEILRLEPTPDNIAQGTADEVSWKIYGLGVRAAHEGLIFSKVDIVKELPSREEWKRHFYGQDFGFSNDPSALIHIVLAHGELYFDEIFYKRGLTNIRNSQNPHQQSIQEMYETHNIKKYDRIWADKAEPKSIQDLVNCGYNIKAADKGPDSVNAGIDLILRYKCHITERSINAIKEKNNYKWKADKAGVLLNEPIDAWNHFWDSCRYGCVMELGRGNYAMPQAGHGSGKIFN